ncbi:hypothetical protein FBEOM_2409 [Fusarium beomiforme]|uniref:Uncharacterized protein n=1 Tax=Fusarium beomiforme TaxID=44412 RepID=A0A9P5AS29_9HYPO|nr:hypothetical protein FBEOM_2409 [Fusarium beomiforme]
MEDSNKVLIYDSGSTPKCCRQLEPEAVAILLQNQTIVAAWNPIFNPFEGQVAEFNGFTAKDYITIAFPGCDALLVGADTLNVERLWKFARLEAKGLMKLNEKVTGTAE